MSGDAKKHIATLLAPGFAEASPFVLAEPLSFWGGLDSATGRIIDRWHPQKDAIITGRILLMTAGRGSSSGSSVLAEAIRLGKGPAGIVLLSRDAIVTVGAMVAAELYGIACPVVMAREEDWAEISSASRLTLQASGDAAFILLP
ncbi:aconitase subunit 2 [Pararhizobium antarcticum]|uniref:Aconitase subunit 2 n=1 Tax=Pararhizobium antarcticum TaxID=1798805 RepID=A0A657M085_9HYPH|nr:aconitase subunit 2 [Rhizobium sp. 58]OJG01586.1 aconitase subunit 2 [Pararhizobium antarcticum]